MNSFKLVGITTDRYGRKVHAWEATGGHRINIGAKHVYCGAPAYEIMLCAHGDEPEIVEVRIIQRMDGKAPGLELFPSIFVTTFERELKRVRLACELAGVTEQLLNHIASVAAAKLH